MERRWSVPIISALSALLAVVLVAPGLDPVTGAIPNANGKYSACLTKATGAVRVINYPKVTCAKGQRLISWNAKGPAGAQGAQGPQGVQGAQGPAGPADWDAIPNKPAGFADGKDDVGYVTATTACPAPVPASPGFLLIEFFDLPRNMVHDFQVVPTANAGYIYVDELETLQQLDGDLKITVKVTNVSGPATSCNIRRISFTDGISIAIAKKQLKDIRISVGKRKRR